MAYLYICEMCLMSLCERCEGNKGEGYGVGICACRHVPEEDRSDLEKSVREKYGKER